MYLNINLYIFLKMVYIDFPYVISNVSKYIFTYKYDGLYIESNRFIILINFSIFLSIITIFIQLLYFSYSLIVFGKLRYYVDKSYRPVCRGQLHFIISHFLMINVLVLSASLLYDLHTLDRILLNNFIFLTVLYGKLLSYFTSAILHCSNDTALSHISYKAWHSADIISIGISIYSSTFAYITLDKINIIPFFFIFLLIYSEKYDNILLRLISILLFTSWSMYFTGNCLNYNLIWTISIIFYNLSFIMMIPNIVDYDTFNIHIRKLPWHKNMINGYHEDFHLLVLLADILTVINSYNYLYNSL